MSTRRDAREWILQLLFQLDLNSEKAEDVFVDFWSDKGSDKDTKDFVESIVVGVQEHKADIDVVISQRAEHWTIGRMSVIDRNVLRMAIYEIMHRSDIPSVVSINEAVDIAKYFSNNESGKFVNGILDRARKDLEKDEKS